MVQVFNKTKATRSMPGKTLANGYLSHYQSAGLEYDAYDLAAISFKVKSHSSVFKEVAICITTSGPAASESMAKSLLRRRWAAESDQTT